MEEKIYRVSERIDIWLRRNKKSMQWLSKELGISRHTLYRRLDDNQFKESEKAKLRSLGFTL